MLLPPEKHLGFYWPTLMLWSIQLTLNLDVSGNKTGWTKPPDSDNRGMGFV